MGADKLLLEYRGKLMLQHALELLSNLPVYEKIIVTTTARVVQVEIPQGVQVVLNKNPESGQSSSVRLGVENSTGSFYFFIAADQPGLTVDALMPLLEAAEKNADKIIFPIINKSPCSPTLFPSSFRSKLLALSDDMGGRTIRDAYPEKCMGIKPKLPELFFDIDTINDYEEHLRG
jgi:molybdenum cofactor cytidylyltransferase